MSPEQTDKQMLAAELATTAHVWLLKVDEVTASEPRATGTALLSLDESSRYDRFRFDADRHLYRVAHIMLRRVLSAYADIDPAMWRFSHTAHGRPEIAGPETSLPLRFNLSHTRGLATCVVTRTVDCGVDAEEITQRRNVTGIAERMFARDEQRVLQGLDGSAYLEQFFTYWTLREAYCKARGSGLAGSGKHFWFEPGDAGGWQIRSGTEQTETGRWKVAARCVSGTHMVAVALNAGTGPPPGVKFLDFNL